VTTVLIAETGQITKSSGRLQEWMHIMSYNNHIRGNLTVSNFISIYHLLTLISKVIQELNSICKRKYNNARIYYYILWPFCLRNGQNLRNNVYCRWLHDLELMSSPLRQFSLEKKWKTSSEESGAFCAWQWFSALQVRCLKEQQGWFALILCMSTYIFPIKPWDLISFYWKNWLINYTNVYNRVRFKGLPSENDH